MRKLRESKAMQDDFISCVSILGYSIFIVSNHLELEPWHWIIMTVGAVLFVAALVLRSWRLRRDKKMTQEEQQELERERHDERSQMLQSKAKEYCWHLEDVLLLIALLVFVLRGQSAIYCVLFLIEAVRILVNTVIRWWLERKY